MNINETLKDFNLESKFDYEANELNSKVIAIFDKDFNLISKTIINQQNYIVLDQTCIYALSGGEEPDKGWIELDGNKIEISNCIKAPNGQHLHLIVSNIEIKVGDELKVCCDVNAKQVVSCCHTAEHLLQGTLQKLVDPNLKQMGVNLTHHSLSVSFEHKEKLSDEQLNKIEEYINSAIAKAIPVEIYFKTLEEARALGVRAKFDNVYSKVKGLLRIVKIDDIYTVLCAGRHAHNTKDLEQFHILKMTSKGSNVWKIEAIATDYLTNLYITNFNEEIKSKIAEISNEISENKFDNQDFINKLNKIELSSEWYETINNLRIVNELKNEFNKLLEAFKNKQLNLYINDLINNVVIDTNKPYRFIQLDNQPSSILNTLGSNLIKKYPNNGFVIINVGNGKIAYGLIKSPIANIAKPNELIKQINPLINGKGGGKENQCQGSCPYLEESINKIKQFVENIK